MSRVIHPLDGLVSYHRFREPSKLGRASNEPLFGLQRRSLRMRMTQSEVRYAAVGPPCEAEGGREDSCPDSRIFRLAVSDHDSANQAWLAGKKHAHCRDFHDRQAGERLLRR